MNKSGLLRLLMHEIVWVATVNKRDYSGYTCINMAGQPTVNGSGLLRLHIHKRVGVVHSA